MVFNVTFNIFQLYRGGGAITKPFIEVLHCSYIKLLFLQWEKWDAFLGDIVSVNEILIELHMMPQIM